MDPRSFDFFATLSLRWRKKARKKSPLNQWRWPTRILKARKCNDIRTTTRRSLTERPQSSPCQEQNTIRRLSALTSQGTPLKTLSPVRVPLTILTITKLYNWHLLLETISLRRKRLSKKILYITIYHDGPVHSNPFDSQSKYFSIFIFQTNFTNS